MPTAEPAISILAAAITKLNNAPFPTRLTRSWRQFMGSISPYMPVYVRALISNLWLFEPLVKYVFSQQPSMNAGIRTTMVPTILRSGTKDNVQPRTATAIFNIRLLQGETLDDVQRHFEKVIGDKRVTLTRISQLQSNPSPESSTTSYGWKVLSLAIQGVYPQRTIIAPNTVLGATDARYFHELSDSVYRFAAVTVTPIDLPRIHGINERIASKDFFNMISFYSLLIRASQTAELPHSRTTEHEEL